MKIKMVGIGLIGLSLLAVGPISAAEMAGMSDKDCSTHCDLRELQKQVDGLKSSATSNESSGEKASAKAAKRAQLERDIKIDEDKLSAIKAQLGTN